ncbi:DUF342 domain-containing protein [Endothiovibrio diazotrophicus]
MAEQAAKTPPPAAGGRGHDIRFSLSEDGTKLRATFPPHDPKAVPPINSHWVSQALDRQGFGDLYPIDDALAHLVELYNAGDGDRGELNAIAERRDAVVQFKVSTDKMHAYAFTSRPFGGEPLSKQAIHSALMQEGIVYGVLTEALDELLSTPQAANVLIAKGRPPEDGEDTRFDSLIPEARRRGPVIDDRGRADYRELGGVVMVKPGDPVMRRVPATSGVNGEDVTGKTLLAQPGKEIPFANECSGVAVDDYDENILVATVAGQPMLIDYGVQVEGTFRAKDIDLSTGNIRFDGTIQIDRDVLQGMRLQATGDININGSVEGAVLEAGGSILINGGIIGNGEVRDEEDNLSETVAQLYAGGKITANFAQNAFLDAQGDIEIKRSISHSEVTTHKGEILVGAEKASKGGNILGGLIRAPKRVRAQVIGSPAHVETRIEVGVDPELQEAVDKVEERLEPKKADLIKIVRLITEINKNKEKFPPRLQEKARTTFLQLKQEVTHLTSEREKLMGKLQHISDARVDVGKVVHPGVTIRMGEISREFRDESSPGSYRLEEGEIIRDEPEQ